jgi:lipopolysaccharide export system protein LptC
MDTHHPMFIFWVARLPSIKDMPYYSVYHMHRLVYSWRGKYKPELLAQQEGKHHFQPLLMQ